MICRIHIKGLKPDQDDFESHYIDITFEEGDDVDSMIASLIYEIRNTHSFYKLKYCSKEIIRE